MRILGNPTVPASLSSCRAGSRGAIHVATEDKIAQLDRQLSRHSLGPVDGVSNQAASAIASAATSIANWLRQVTYDRPLISLLLAFEAGLLIGRLGRRYARN